VTGASAPSALRRATVSGVRAQIAAGELAAARAAFEALRTGLGASADVLVTEGLLLEAEGKLEASLTSFQRARAAAPASAYPSGQVARLLARLERPAEAEAAALSTLALDDANPVGLAALVYAYASAGRTEERLDVVRRLAAIPGLGAARLWSAIGDLAGALRWTDVLRILDERVDDLPPGRACLQRVEALLGLDRQADALGCLTAAQAAGHVKPAEVVERLVARRAVALAAAFIQQCPLDTSGAAREIVHTEAARVCVAVTLEASPFDHADAILAQRILFPDRAGLGEAVERAAAVLVEQARAHLVRGEDSLATDTLIRAARLAPADLTVLDLLAAAAERAGRADRHLETLLRIYRLRPSPESLTVAVEAAIRAEWWTPLGDLMARAQGQSSTVMASSGAIDGLRGRLHDSLETLLRVGDADGALTLVAALQPWMTLRDWPAATIARLLAAAKRHLRRPRASGAIGRLAASYLSLDPGDLDVQRLLARLHLRHRRLRDAAGLLAGVVRADPHVARDWLDLAKAHDGLGEAAQRDLCLARAHIIAPPRP